MKRPLAAAVLIVVLAGGPVLAEPAASELELITTGTRHQSLYDIAFDGQSGVAVGVAGAIFESSDGGQHWQAPDKLPSPLGLLGVAIRGTKRIAVGQTGTVLVRDGSSGWRLRPSGAEAARLFSVSLNASGLAVAVGSFGTVIKSTDAGQTWASAAPVWASLNLEGVEPHMYAVNVADDGVITVAGELGLILRSSDGGASWVVTHRGEASVFALDLRTDGGGYAVGQSGSVLRTRDHGEHWTEVNVGSSAILLGVSSNAQGQVVMTGMRDMLISADGEHWRHVSTQDVVSGWYQGVARSGDHVIVVGDSGRIIRVGS